MARLRSKPVELVIRGPDEATEIFLIDASLKRIASGVGRLTARVAPGLYKIRYRSGATQNDTLIQVPEDQPTYTVTGTPVQFRAAAPIADTSTTHEYQTAPARDQSRKVHQSIGKHSQLFLFAREVSDKKPWPSCDIALHDLRGERLLGLEFGFTNPNARIAGINIELDPGTYAVRVSNDALGSYEMYVTASPNWQTQLFFSFEDFWSHGERVRAPSIRQASLLMAPAGRGFYPGDESTRTSELARQGLAQGRDVVSKDLMDRLLYGKFENPVLGIIGAHLLLRRGRHNVELLETVCGNLRSMLGEHPDVQALELALGRTAKRAIEEFAAPPSFRHSWDEIVKATRRKASLVPSAGVVARIAANVVRAGVWLTRRVPDFDQPAVSTITTIAGASRLVERIFAQAPETLVNVARAARSQMQPLSSIEQAVLSTALSFARNRSMRESLPTEEPKSSESDVKKTLLANIPAPSYVVASAVASLASKLDIKG